MRKGVQLILLSILIAFLCLVVATPHAFASTRQSATGQIKFTAVSRVRRHSSPHGGGQTQNQFFHGNTFSDTHIHLRGHNQNNIGNQGHNRGVNRSFAANGGNLIVNSSRAGRHQRVNQVFEGESYSHSHLDEVGYNQTNSGNQGFNEGYNEDHGANGGNQIVN